MVTGTATPSGAPGRRGPGQVPAVSVTWARAPLSTAAWISGGWDAPGGRGSASWSDQRPVASANGTVPRAERTRERMTGSSARACAAPNCPLTPMGVAGSPASRARAAAGSARPANPASPVVTVTDTRMASSRLAGSSGADRVRRSTNSTRDPRAAPLPPGRGAVSRTSVPRLRPMMRTLLNDGGARPGAQGDGYPFGA